MFRSNRAKTNHDNNGFVNALSWDELRQSFKREPSQVRGERSLTAAMQAENPDFSDLPLQRNRRASWNLSFVPDEKTVQQFAREPDPLQSQDVDNCFADLGFDYIPDVAKHRFDIQINESDFDLELGLLEAVQDVSMAVARVQVRRAANAPAMPTNDAAESEECTVE